MSDIYGITADGINLPRAADWLTLIRDDYEARTGLVFDWERDLVLSSLTAVAADRLGEVSDIIQDIYDTMDPGNAVGLHLDVLASLSGIDRRPATHSTATATCTGTPGVFIPGGSLVEGGGPIDRSRWATVDDATIGVLGTVDVTVQAEDVGEVTATIGQIDKIVNPVTGWTSVTNAADATPGEDLESDDDFRARWRTSLQTPGTANVNSLRGKVADIDFLTAAVVIENPNAAAAIVEGISMDPSSVAVVVYPSGLSSAQIAQVATVIYQNLPAGIKTVDTPATTVTATVTDAGGGTKTIAFSYATALPVTVAFVVTLESGYAIGDVDQALIDAVVAWFADLAVGDDVTLLDMFGLAAGIAGIRSVTSLLLNGAAVDIAVAMTQVATTTPGDVTVIL